MYHESDANIAKTPAADMAKRQRVADAFSLQSTEPEFEEVKKKSRLGMLQWLGKAASSTSSSDEAACIAVDESPDATACEELFDKHEPPSGLDTSVRDIADGIS